MLCMKTGRAYKMFCPFVYKIEISEDAEKLIKTK